MSSPERGIPASNFDRRLTEAFREGLDLPPDTDVTGLVFGEHDHWDSLGHVQLVIALEAEFDLHLTGSNVMELRSYAAAAEVVRSHRSTLS
ncbi:Acyl carrier protein OS=Streptomyces fumanus OX=67302 GN=acpP PE=4 SV=1 [Streptomyces fumanus]